MMNPNDLLTNHGRVIGYLRALSGALVRTTATVPEGIPAELGAAVQEQASKYAQLLDLAAEVLAEEPVVLTMLVEASRQAREGAAEESEEPRLTTRKVAQA